MKTSTLTKSTAWLVALGLVTACSPSGDAGKATAGQEEHADEDDHGDHGAEEDHDDHGDEGGHDDHGDEGGHDDHGESDGHVELTQTQFDSAGIETTVARSGQVHESMMLTGTIAPNANSVQHVTPRVPGRVRQALKQLGEPVKKGELLCIIDSVELGAAVADYMRDKAMQKAAQTTLERERDLFEGRRVALTKVVEGSIDVQKRIYEREKDLQAKGVSTVRPLLEAERALEFAILDKGKLLNELSAERDTRLLALDVQLQAITIDVTAATNRLKTMGLTGDQLQNIPIDSPLLAGEYRVYASGDGIIVSRHVSAGEFVPAGFKLYVVEDLSDVWFVASAYEIQLQSLRTGQKSEVVLDAFPGTTLPGTVSFLDYRIDPVTRTVGVRIDLNNDIIAGWSEKLPLRPGMFGSVDLHTDPREAAVIIPERALVHEDGLDATFVQTEPLGFELREVTVKHMAGGLVEVISGLEAGERVVVAGTFLLKSAERQSELGGGHSH